MCHPMSKEEHEQLAEFLRSLQYQPTEADRNAFLNSWPISENELPKARSDIKQIAQRIFDNWHTLQSVVQCHESTIQKRWTKKSKLKRRALLLSVWPNMARDHRPDLVMEAAEESQAWLEKEKEFDRRFELKLQGKVMPRSGKFYEAGTQREALLMPWINQHDLCKAEPLLLMINSRGRNPPHTFSTRDLQSATFNIDETEWRFTKGYIMDFKGRSSPDTYGRLQKGEWTLKIDTFMGSDPRIAGGTINTGDGLWILEIQDRVYKFLVEAIQKILHDIPVEDLTAPRWPIQPEPPLPTANSKENGVVSLATTNLEASYTAPGQMDLGHLQCLLTTKAQEAEDKLWALREDPALLTECLEDFIAHRPEFVPDLNGRQHPTTRSTGFLKVYGAVMPGMRNLHDVHIMMFLMIIFDKVEFWGDLAEEVTRLVELKGHYFDGTHSELGNALQEPFATALCTFIFHLAPCLKEQITILRHSAHASPPLRPYLQRPSPDSVQEFVPCYSREPPVQIINFLTLLARLCDEDRLDFRGHLGSTQSILDEYDYFMSNAPGASTTVSPYIAEKISDLALVSECSRHVQLSQPWAASLHEAMAKPHVKTAIQKYQAEQKAKMLPLRAFRPSLHVLDKAIEVTELPSPAHKKRAAQNVAAMQNAENLLDDMWKTLLDEMQERKALPYHSRRVLMSQGRQLYRTADWIEPAQAQGVTQKPSPKYVGLDQLAQHFDDVSKVETSSKKTKHKTRGTANPVLNADQQPQPLAAATAAPHQDSEQNTIMVDKRSLKVFSALFHKPSSSAQPGEVPWTEFLHAMHSAGFSMEKLYGSAWQFTPGPGLADDSGSSGQNPGLRGIQFHEPHPHSKIPIRHAKILGRRLLRAYGWTGETFVAK